MGMGVLVIEALVAPAGRARAERQSGAFPTTEIVSRVGGRRQGSMRLRATAARPYDCQARHKALASTICLAGMQRFCK